MPRPKTSIPLSSFKLAMLALCLSRMPHSIGYYHCSCCISFPTHNMQSASFGGWLVLVRRFRQLFGTVVVDLLPSAYFLILLRWLIQLAAGEPVLNSSRGLSADLASWRPLGGLQVLKMWWQQQS